MDPGERMLLWCEGGPSIGRATTFPPPLEIAVDGGIYVLVDDGPVEEWHYTFIAEQTLSERESTTINRRSVDVCIRR